MIIKVDFKTGECIKDDLIQESPRKKLPLFHKSDYKPSKKCTNRNTYGIICIKCGQCGRKFNIK